MKTKTLALLLACSLGERSIADDQAPGVGRDFDPRASLRGARFATHSFCFKDEPGAPEPESKGEVDKIRAEFTSTMEELKGVIQKRDAEIKQFGEAREETGKQVKALDAKLGQLGEDMTGVLEKFSALEKDHKELMGKMGRPGPDQPAQRKSYGEMFVESEAYKSMAARNGANSERAEVPSFMFQQRKALSSGASSAGDLIDPSRVAGIFAMPQRQFRMRDLIMVQQTNELTVEYVEETAFYQLYTEIASQAASGQKDIVVDLSRGFFVGQTIVVAPGTGNEETHVVADLDHDTNTLTTTSNLANTHAVDIAVTADDFVYTPELQLKPQANATFNLVQSPMKTLAHWIPASRQILRNRQMLRSHIDARLMQGLELSEENQILYGDNSADQLQGLMTHANAQSYAWSDGQVGDTKLDAVRRAITLSQLAHYPVDGTVLNPTDWEDIELAKGEDLHYLWVNVASGGGMTIWRVPIVVTTAMQSGDFLAGAFSMGAALWDGEQASIRVAEQHEDYFTRNMVAILAEQQATQTVYRPESFVVGDFDAAPS